MIEKKDLGSVEGAELVRWSLVEFCERLSKRLKGQVGDLDQEELQKMVGSIDADLARILSIVAGSPFSESSQE